MNVYAVSSVGGQYGVLEFSQPHGKQFIWLTASILVIVVTAFLDYRLIISSSYILYGLSIILLILTLVIGREINGARSWLYIGGQSFQPSEFAKFATAMALAKYVSELNFSIKRMSSIATASALILLPAAIVILQNDTGSALVFLSLFIVLYREGLNPILPLSLILIAAVSLLTLGIENQWIVRGIIVGIGFFSFLVLYNKRIAIRLAAIHLIAIAFFIGFSLSAKLLVERLPKHQQDRIMVLFDPGLDPLGKGYNVIQSKIAIGSGGWMGKGYLDGNYTKYKFVPKQVTDFIFCTVGEEWGWVGATFTIMIFFLLLWRTQFIAENSKTTFARAYGYGVFSLFFCHAIINVGMTIGLIPVIGIPLPLFSYGGSAIIAFTLLTAVLINLYSHRVSVLGNK